MPRSADDPKWSDPGLLVLGSLADGAKHGLASFANQISQGSDGRFHAANSADRAAILALRKDPQVAALMAGEYSNATRATLEASLGRGVCGGELYAAHFLGADAACRLIRMNSAAPGTNAAQAFPAAAASNRSVFYRPDGSAKSVREVYDWALKQPGGAAPIARTEAKVSATFASATAPDQNIETLLANVMNWRPAHGFFAMGGEMTDSAPNSSPLMLTADMLKVLSSNG